MRTVEVMLKINKSLALRVVLALGSFFISALILNFLCGILLQNGIINEGNARGAIYYKLRQPHPYLGFISSDRVGTHPTWQNSSHLSEPKDPTVLTVGLFGGSVAFHFGEYLKTEPAKSRFAEAVAKKYGVGKRVEIMNFAEGAWYQPQALLATVLYGKDLDVALSLEGANEVLRGVSPDFPADFPRSRLTRAFFGNSFENHFNLVLMDITKASAEALETLSSWGWFPSLNTAVAITIKNAMRSWLKEPILESIDPIQLSRIWSEAVDNQQIFLQARRIPHLFLIQPIPCLNPQSLAAAPDICANYNESLIFQAQIGLADFRKEAARKRISYIDFSDLFSKWNSEDFLDDLHFTPQGNERLLESIIKAAL